jgi:PPM family protein phosphatase
VTDLTAREQVRHTANVRVAVATARNGRPTNEDAVGLAGWVLTGDSDAARADRGRPAVLGPLEFVLPVTSGRAVLIALADGIGGSPGGALAARIAAESLSSGHTHMDEDWARVIFADAHRRIQAETDGSGLGMGCTAALVAIHVNLMTVVANVGDVRVYRIVDGYAGRLTVDHRLGRGPDDSAIVTRCLGGFQEQPAEPHAYAVPVEIGDRLVLCSDGLHDAIAVSTSAAGIRATNPARAAWELAQAALAPSGTAGDNVTVVVADILPVAGPRP